MWRYYGKPHVQCQPFSNFFLNVFSPSRLDQYSPPQPIIQQYCNMLHTNMLNPINPLHPPTVSPPVSPRHSLPNNLTPEVQHGRKCKKRARHLAAPGFVRTVFGLWIRPTNRSNRNSLPSTAPLPKRSIFFRIFLLRKSRDATATTITTCTIEAPQQARLLPHPPRKPRSTQSVLLSPGTPAPPPRSMNRPVFDCGLSIVDCFHWALENREAPRVCGPKARRSFGKEPLHAPRVPAAGMRPGGDP